MTGGGATVVEDIGLVDNTGEYAWTVYAPATAENICQIRIRGSDGAADHADLSDATFTLAPLADVSISATDAAEAGQSPGSFTITRSGGSPGDLVVTVEVDVSSTATDPDDYSLTGPDAGGTTVTILDGQSSVTVTVVPVDDSCTSSAAKPSG